MVKPLAMSLANIAKMSRPYEIGSTEGIGKPPVSIPCEACLSPVPWPQIPHRFVP